MTERGAPASLQERPLSGPLPLFAVPGWGESFGVVAGVTGRGPAEEAFDLGLGPTGPAAGAPRRWQALLEHLDGFQGVVVGRQVHGTEVAWHGAVTGVRVLPGIDGHGTDHPGTLLAVSLADCIPVYLFDPARRAATLLHAGWRGTRAGVLQRGVAALVERAGSRPGDIVMHCGVGICGVCYEVGPEVLEAFGRDSGGAKGHLDLRAVLAEQGRARGLGQVTVSDRCSAHEQSEFFSHRASGGHPARMAAYLGFTS